MQEKNNFISLEDYNKPKLGVKNYQKKNNQVCDISQFVRF